MFKTFKLFDRYACSIGLAFEKGVIRDSDPVVFVKNGVRGNLQSLSRFEQFERLERFEHFQRLEHI